MGLLVDFLTLMQSGLGWLLVLGLAIWELFAPKVLDRDTVLSPLLHDVPERQEEIAEKQDELVEQQSELREDVERVEDQNETQMQVQRALSRATDGMDPEKVDDYLLQNGVSVDTFLTDDTEERYRADGGHDEESES